jgi:hypothetical protein
MTEGDDIVRTAIFLNRWTNIFHLILVQLDGEQCIRMDSRYARSLEQARKAVEYWRTEFNVANEDVHDNSCVNMDEIFSWMDLDMDDLEGRPW